MQHSNALLGEAGRCIHIGDRENDIFEFFSDAVRLGTHFLVRTCVDRLAGDGGHTIAKEMNAMPVQAIHEIKVRDQKGNMVTASVELKYKRIHVLPPIGKQKCYSPLDLTVIHACERHTPEDRDRIDWKLITDLSVTSPKQAIKNLQWYAMRWKIEVFHKILKSGCQAEHAKLRTAERLVNLLAIYCVLGWRIFWMTMLNRSNPDAAPALALTRTEIRLLDHFVPDQGKPSHRKSISPYLIKIARLGGYLARASDPPPGNIVMWRGLSRLTDIKLGALAWLKCE